MEIMVSTVIGGLMAGGVMLAFLTSMKLSGGASNIAEAAFYTQQTLERFRNKIACRQTGEGATDTWYDTSCNPASPIDAGPQNDVLPGTAPIKVNFGATRQYQVTSVDCDGVGGAGDCLQVEAKGTWTEPQ